MKTLPLLVLLAAAPGLANAQDVFDLPVGDPARSGRALAPALDVIVATDDEAELSPADLARRLAGVRLLLIGESHTNADFHEVQVRVLNALAAAGRRVLVGLEMYPFTEQASLDRWNDGSWDEQTFVRESEWYRHWSYNWRYYREIFLAAREHGAPMYAVNAPRAAVSAVRRDGLDSLSAEEREGLPPTVDVESEDHFALFKAYFDEDAGGAHGGTTDAQWRAMFAAQCTWDAAMAWNAVRHLEADPDPSTIMVVMVGSGHVSYGLGIARQAEDFFDGPVATLIPVPIADQDGSPVERVRASYADFIWGIPADGPPQYPSLGLSVAANEDGVRVLFADPDSPGGAAGLTTGDRLVSVDGWQIDDRMRYHEVVADLRWGDMVRVEFVRDGTTEEVVVTLRRQ